VNGTERALNFLVNQDRPVELAWGRVTTGTGSFGDLIDALERYQNPDGGFGQNLEVDIEAPDSQPFAARLAMIAMIDAGVASDSPIVQRLSNWLEREQGEDGCWRFPPGVFEHPLAPWFAGWTFPSLNPALDLAGLAHRLEIGSDRLFARIDRLVAELADPAEAESGEFYNVLPYAEFFPWSPHPERERYLVALARGIQARAESGGYDDAGHFFEHVGGPESAIAKRLPQELIDGQLDRLEGEQAEDGGWPSPYNQLWRSWTTAGALATLRVYGRIGTLAARQG
jgi:hypothetical protein